MPAKDKPGSLLRSNASEFLGERFGLCRVKVLDYVGGQKDLQAGIIRTIGRPELLTDPRFVDPAQLTANRPQLTAILDEVFGSQPMAHWYDVFSGVHVTFGAVRGPQEVISDAQLQANDIIVPLNGAGGKLTSTISSPLQVHGVAKVPAKRAPKIGEHNEEVLRQLGFSADEIDGLRTSGAIPKAKQHVA